MCQSKCAYLGVIARSQSPVWLNSLRQGSFPNDVIHTLPAIPAVSARTWQNAKIMQRKGPGPPRGFGRRRDGRGKPPPNRNYRSIHGRNLKIFAAPLLFIFAVLRTLAYQLWVALFILGCRSRRALTQRSAEQKVTDEEAPCLSTPMASNDKCRQGVGPGEPALALQKHHHRKAFEHISRALKIDEEDSGLFTFCLVAMLHSVFQGCFTENVVSFVAVLAVSCRMYNRELFRKVWLWRCAMLLQF